MSWTGKRTLAYRWLRDQKCHRAADRSDLETSRKRRLTSNPGYDVPGGYGSRKFLLRRRYSFACHRTTTDDMLNYFNVQFGSDKPDTRFGLEVSQRFTTTPGSQSRRRSGNMCHSLTCQYCRSTPSLYIIQIQDVTEAVTPPPTLPQSHDVQSAWECIVLRKDQDAAFEGADKICRDDHEDGVVSQPANLSEYMRSKF